MKTIWKFPLELTERQAIEMPIGAIPLSVQSQDGTLTLWAEVETENPLELVILYIYGTGARIDPELRLTYLGTDQMLIGFLSYVWHVYREESKEEN